MESILVATTLEGQLPYFPSLVRTGRSDLLVVYREGRHHICSNGRIVAVESNDNGQSWAAPRVIIDTIHDDRDPMLTRLANGDLLLLYFQIDWSRIPWRIPALRVSRSTDNGRTWSGGVAGVGARSEEGDGSSGCVEIDSTICTETDQRWHRFEAGHVCAHGRLLELPNGDILAPAYGVYPGDEFHSSVVVRSTDSGETFPRENEVVLARGDQMYGETVLTLLPDGGIVALIRTEQTGVICRSTDNGHTFTEPEPFGLVASSADTVTLADGTVVLAYGDYSEQTYPGRPTMLTHIPEPDGPWDCGEQTKVYDTADEPGGRSTFDQANPSVVELDNGDLYVVTYDVYRRAIVGVVVKRAQLSGKRAWRTAR